MTADERWDLVARHRNIAAKVAELAGLWRGPEWTVQYAAEDAARFIEHCIETGVTPEDVERALRAHLNG
jgi:predicted oxidoreductase